MRLTPRCLSLLRLLPMARWLTTAQIQRRFYPSATADTVRKRLRKLTADGYLVAVRPSWMSQSHFTLGPRGKTVLEDDCRDPVILERRPPVHLEHFRGVNDCRIAAELADCGYFFAYWELPKIPWRHPLIPDAILSLRDENLAIEFDRGFEGAAFFAKTKLPHYQRGFQDLPCSRVLVITESPIRMRALARVIVAGHVDVLFSTVDLIRSRGFYAPIFYRNPIAKSEPKGLSLVSPDVRAGFPCELAGNTSLDPREAGAIKGTRP
jgi:hypothetical protein